MNLYEGMFLLNSAEAKRDWAASSGHVKEILTKHGAEVLKDVLWDDRKLAYDVAGQKRGAYYLVFFKLDPLKLAALRYDCELSERILRQLFLRHEGTEVPAYPMPVPEGEMGPGAAPEGMGGGMGGRERRREEETTEA